MNDNASVTDLFKSPVWGRNLLFGALALIIPVVGPNANTSDGGRNFM